MKLNCYDNFTDCYTEYKDYYKTNHADDPNLSLISCEEFINDLDFDFAQNCAENVRKELTGIRYYYLFLIVLKEGSSEKIFDYYKVWKKIKDEIPISKTGIEKKYQQNNKSFYVSAAAFEGNQIQNIISFMLHNQRNSFIYATESSTVLNPQNSMKIFDSISNPENHIGTNELFGFKQFFQEMRAEDAVIYLSSDGERIGMDILKKGY